MTVDREDNVLNCFEQAMENYLSAKIKSALQGKLTKDDLERLERLGCSSILPRGLISDTAKLVGCNSGKVSTYLDTKCPKKKNDVMWRVF